MLMEYYQWRKIHMMAYGIRTNLLFMNQWSNMISAPVYDRYVKTIKSNKRLHAHLFRHTHASLLAEAGYSLEAISRRLGHSDSDITKKIYLHITEKMRKQDEEKLNRIRLIN
jgi:integrase